MDIYVEDLIYEKVDINFSEVSSSKVGDYKIYRIKLNKGDINRFLIIPYYMNIPIGDNELYIKPIENLSKNYKSPFTEMLYLLTVNTPLYTRSVQWVHSVQNIDKVPIEPKFKERFENGDIEALWEYLDWYNSNIENVFFTVTNPISDIFFDTIKKWDQNQFSQMIDEYLEQDCEKDDRLMYIYRALLLKTNRGDDDPTKLMPYSPHGIIITNPKTGKSSTSYLVGKKYDQVSLARMIGFSTAKETSKGVLNGKHETISFDEIQEEVNEGLFNKILDFEERGVCEVAKGKENVITKGTSPLVYIGNPTSMNGSGKSSSELMYSFEEILQKVTDNYEAFGSRKAFCLFGNDFDVVRQKFEKDEDEINEINGIVETILAKATPEINLVFKKKQIRKWLQNDFPDDYKTKISDLIKKLTSTPVKRYWKGHLSSYRHVRGFALRQAIIDNIGDIIKGFPAVSQILADAENHFEEICHINYNSLKKMTDIDLSDSVKITKEMFDSIKPLYLKHVITGLCYAYHFKNLDGTKIIPMEIVANYYSEIPDEFKSETFVNWGRVKSKIGNIKRFNNKLRNIAGVKMIPLNENNVFKIEDVEQIKILSKAIFEKETKDSSIGDFEGL